MMEEPDEFNRLLADVPARIRYSKIAERMTLFARHESVGLHLNRHRYGPGHDIEDRRHRSQCLDRRRVGFGLHAHVYAYCG